MEEKILNSQEMLMKAVLANTSSATKISKVLADHSEDKILKADEIILGLMYRLMTPMTDEEMIQSINEAESLLYQGSSEEDSEEENIVDDTDDLSISKKIKCNTCNCEICMRCRVCLSNFNDYIPKDNLGDIFKNSILETCKIHNRII
jgi:hypothetical protein